MPTQLCRPAAPPSPSSPPPMPAVANAFVVARPVPASIAEEDEGALDDAFGQLSKAVDAHL